MDKNKLKVLPNARLLKASDGTGRLFVDTGGEIIPVAANQQVIDLTTLLKPLLVDPNNYEQTVEISHDLLQQICKSTSLDTVYKIPLTPAFAINIPLMESMAAAEQSAETMNVICSRGTVFCGSTDAGYTYMVGYINIIAICDGNNTTMKVKMQTI